METLKLLKQSYITSATYAGLIALDSLADAVRHTGLAAQLICAVVSVLFGYLAYENYRLARAIQKVE